MRFLCGVKWFFVLLSCFNLWPRPHQSIISNENGAVLLCFKKDLLPHLSFSPVHTATLYPFWKHFYSLSAQCHSRSQSLRSFWPVAGIESSGSNHFEITKEITEFCPSGFTAQSASMAHAWNSCSQSPRFLPQARRIVGSGYEIVRMFKWTWRMRISIYQPAMKPHCLVSNREGLGTSL